ncbi:hypothetical protein [Iningainema tapete]|uniref:Uncharacterized protein n=1 Tax=Iningainema tapete BLCC-T55 TaxID=2748662 RepID=A0A8J7C9Y5_9CYAN|nr:hypothetical protein [Iningainema tapete]MBD2778664.1 hypothetical protein [Iningainema tapete BLCC-T55]
MKFLPFLTLYAVANLIAPAYAIPYKGALIYRAVDKNDKEIVIFSGEPDGSITVKAGTVKQPYAGIANRCGMVRIPDRFKNIMSIKVGITTTDTTNLTVMNMPHCHKVTGKMTPTIMETFRLPSGTVVNVGNEPENPVTVEVTKFVTRTLKMNACGFAVLRSEKDKEPFYMIRVEETNYEIFQLPNANKAPKCFDGEGYLPNSWNN